MRLLSIDPSTKATGWAIFDDNNLIDYGVIKRQDGADSGRIHRMERIVYMVTHLEEIVKSQNIDMIIAEAPLPAINNSDTVLALGNLQGAIMYMSIITNTPIEYIDVGTWHSALQILKSKGDLKKQSITMMNTIYNTELIYKSPSSKFNQSDEADAIAIGHYYLHKDDVKKERKGFRGKQKTI